MLKIMVVKEIKMKINHGMLYAMLLVILCLFLSGCSGKSELEKKAWFQYASKYDRLMSNISEKDSGVMKDMNEALKIIQKYRQVSQPSETEILSILSSSNRGIQRVALSAMSIKPIETDQIAGILFEFLQGQDPVFRWYTLEALNKFSDFSEIMQADLSGKLLDLVKTRKDEELSPRELELLAKFPSEKAALFLTEQLMRESAESRRSSILRFVAFKALFEMGGSYYDNAVKEVHKHGRTEIKEQMMRWEKFLEEK